MKTKFVLSAVIGCGLLWSNSAAAAQRSNTVHTAAQGTNVIVVVTQSSNSVFRLAKYNAHFALRPTLSGPAGAKGSAELQARNSNGDLSGKITVQTKGLPPGAYTVTGVKALDLSTVTLGHFTVKNSTNQTQKKITIPADVNATDINQVNVVDSADVVLLTDSLDDQTGNSSANLNAQVSVSSGNGGPNTGGIAVLKSSVKKGERKDQFTLIVSGAPINTTFTVVVNGTEDGTVRSNFRGRTIVKRLPDGIDTLETVELLNAADEVVARVDF